MNRRTLLKRTLAVGAVSVAASAGLLTPGSVMAAYPKKAFEDKTVEGAMSALLGSSSTADGEIKIKAPDIAENGSVVPVTVDTGIAGAESITIIAAANGTPMVGSFDLTGGAEGYVSTRIKMGKTGDVIAVVKAGGQLYSAKKEVKVTIGGCGG